MQDLRRYLSGHAEQCFALTILVGVACINYFVPYKLIYLNFFFSGGLDRSLPSGSPQGGAGRNPLLSDGDRSRLLFPQQLRSNSY